MTENCLISSLFSLGGCIFFYLWSFLSCTTETCIACDSVVTVSFPRCPPHLPLFRDVVKYVNRLARYTKQLGTLMAKIKLIYKKCLGPIYGSSLGAESEQSLVKSQTTNLGRFFSPNAVCVHLFCQFSVQTGPSPHTKNPPKPGSHYWAGAHSFFGCQGTAGCVMMLL